MQMMKMTAALAAAATLCASVSGCAPMDTLNLSREVAIEMGVDGCTGLVVNPVSVLTPADCVSGDRGSVSIDGVRYSVGDDGAYPAVWEPEGDELAVLHLTEPVQAASTLGPDALGEVPRGGALVADSFGFSVDTTGREMTAKGLPPDVMNGTPALEPRGKIVGLVTRDGDDNATLLPLAGDVREWIASESPDN